MDTQDDATRQELETTSESIAHPFQHSEMKATAVPSSRDEEQRPHDAACTVVCQAAVQHQAAAGDAPAPAAAAAAAACRSDPETPDKQASELEQLGAIVDARMETIIDCLVTLKGAQEDPAFIKNVEQLSASISAVINTPDRLRVGFCGVTGAGKTTLLNRVIGKDLLPVGDGSAITAALTEVHNWAHPKYLAIVYFVELVDWEDLVSEAKREAEEQRKCEDYIIGPSITILHSALKAFTGD
jgi:hypothetical protein